MLLNLQSHVIEADFHTFVRPTEELKLSEFCKNYTGISQDDVNNAPLLQDAIKKFHQWIESFRFSKGIVLKDDATRKQNTVFITWTDFDLGIYLPTECARKNLKRPSYFNKWIDLREYYSVSICTMYMFFSQTFFLYRLFSMPIFYNMFTKKKTFFKVKKKENWNDLSK